MDGKKGCSEYVERILGMYQRGEDNAYEAYKRVYGATHEQEEGESDLDYIRRCAEQDYYDGELGAAVYQEIYDELLARGDRKICFVGTLTSPGEGARLLEILAEDENVAMVEVRKLVALAPGPMVWARIRLQETLGVFRASRFVEGGEVYCETDFSDAKRFIRCEESSLGLLGSFGVEVMGFDHDLGGAYATVTASALAKLAQFPADFQIERTAQGGSLAPASARESHVALIGEMLLALKRRMDLDGASTSFTKPEMARSVEDWNTRTKVLIERVGTAFDASGDAASQQREALEALERMYRDYGALHDQISDLIEGGRLNESDIPDDYMALVVALEACVGADDLAKRTLDKLRAGLKPITPRPGGVPDSALEP